MRIFCAIVLGSGLATILSGSENAGLANIDDGFRLKGSNASSNVLEYHIPDFELRTIEENGKILTRPVIPHSGSSVKPGEPDLPSTTTFYAVEPGISYSLQVTIIASEMVDDVDIIHFRTWDNEFEGTVNKSSVYDSADPFPGSIATISETMVMRDLHLVSVTVTPFQYHPATDQLEIITEAEIELIETGTESAAFVPPRRSRAFEPFYRSLVVNYEALDRDMIDYQRPSILYVLPNNIGSLFGTIEVLMDWKRRVGYEVNYISSSNVVNNTNNLKNYIEDAYETWDNPPVYVTIVADAEGSYDVPTWYENWSGYNGEGDHPYSTLEGNDLLPEVLIGRMSFDSQSHLQTVVSKTLNYESTPYMGENWFERACLVGDPSSSGISCIITKENIREMMELYGFEDVRTVYSGSFASQMQSNLSDGLAFFNYRGYYGVSGFGSSNVNGTTNGFMLPIATVITCGTGSFGNGEALSEAFIRAGTASNPKGAVACVGTATLGTHTMFNNVVDMGFYYGTLVEGISSVGGALMAGKLWLSKSYPTNPNDYVSIFSHWNSLMGDASLQMWTAYPEQLNVVHPYAITVGTNFIDVSIINSSGNPVQDAWTTIYRDDDILESGYTNEEGFVRLAVPSVETGEVLVTVTKVNHYPYQSSLQIYDPGVSVNVYSDIILIDDDDSGASSGNSDGIVNSGETVELSVALSNYGSVDAVNILASLLSSNSNVIVTSSTLSYGNIASEEIVSGSEPFVFTVADGLEDGTTLGLSLFITDDDGYNAAGQIDLHVSGNRIFASDVDVFGSTQDVLTPGESSTVHIELHNDGSTAAMGITGTITCASSAIEITDNTGTWNVIPVGGTGSSSSTGDGFEISALEDVVPGAVAHLIVALTTQDGYSSSSIVPVQIGIPTVADPVGPDSYGYYIYDSGDIEYLLAPNYNWVEIDGRYGGDGDYLSSLSDGGNNGDDVETIDLPFTFRFYGQSYDEISICSNGWVGLGETNMASFRNYPVPGAGGPFPMIAGFWDDLKLTNGGRVYTWYDSNNKQFIIQWSRVRTYQNSSTETFQIMLRDPDYYLTPTNDGEILIQYMDFNNTSNGSYSWNQIHGNYCTVGIEDHTMTVGLQYTFNNGYHDAAMELDDETAILITTRGSDIRLHGDLNMDNSLNIFDILILIDFILQEGQEINPFLADINSDGMVNILDMVGLVQIVMGYN